MSNQLIQITVNNIEYEIERSGGLRSEHMLVQINSVEEASLFEKKTNSLQQKRVWVEARPSEFISNEWATNCLSVDEYVGNQA